MRGREQMSDGPNILSTSPFIRREVELGGEVFIFFPIEAYIYKRVHRNYKMGSEHYIKQAPRLCNWALNTLMEGPNICLVHNNSPIAIWFWLEVQDLIAK